MEMEIAVSTATDSPLLDMRGVWFAYGRDPVIRGLDLRAAAGSAVGLIGPNGCGKTTTLHLCCGLLSPSRGEITLSGHPLPGAPREINSLLAYVPDTPGGFEHLSMHEYWRLVAAVHRADADYRRRSEAMGRMLGLDPYLDVPMASLSYGTRRKVALVAAAALDRPLLMLDEVTNGLDPESVVVLERLVRAIVARGRTVLIGTQDIYFAERVCDAVVLMRDGRSTVAGSLAAVKSDHRADTLRDVFLAVMDLDMPEGAIDAAVGRADAG